MASTDKYNLDIQVRINRYRHDGGFTGESLTVNQNVEIKAQNFFEIAGILGKFQELTDLIKEENDRSVPESQMPAPATG